MINNINTKTSSTAPRHPTSTTQACAACKYQRRRCAPDCALAPYFPAEAQRQFLNAHRLFGVSNIHKLLRALGPDPRRRADAMRSIVYHSNARAADPVGGCYRIVLDLERHCAAAAADLSLLLHHLTLYRNNNNINIVPVDDQFSIPVVVEEAQYLEYLDGNYNYTNNNNNNDVSYISSSGSSVENINVRDGGGNGGELEVLQSTMSNLAEEEEEEEEEVGTDVDAKPRFMEMIDVMGNTLVGLEPYEVEEEQEEISSAIDHGSFHCSVDMVSNEEPNPIENVQEHDLIEAASFFTLTSNNSSYV